MRAMRAVMGVGLIEGLEKRVLLAGGTAGVFDTKHGPLAKVGGALAGAWQEYSALVAAGTTGAGFHSRDRLLRTSEDRVAIIARGKGAANTRQLEADLKALGMTNVRRAGLEVSG